MQSAHYLTLLVFHIASLCLTPAISSAGGGASPRVLFIRGGPGTGGFLSGGSDSHLSDIDDANQGPGNTGFGSLKALLLSQGFTVEQVVEGPVTNNTKIDLAALPISAYDVIVFGSNNADYDGADAELVRQFVCRGGAVLFISDANWGGNWGDAPSSDQTFLDPFDLVMNQDAGTYVVSRAAGDFVIAGQDMGGHPILAGPDLALGTADDVDDFDGEGVSPITVTHAIPGVDPVVLAKAKVAVHKNDSPNSGSFAAPTDDDGSLVVLEYGQGRVAGHFDRNTFFNANGAGTDITRFDNAAYAENLFGWLADTSGRTFGAGCGGGAPVPSLDLLGCPRPGETVVLTLDGAAAGNLGVLLFGAAPGSTILPGGCVLLLGGLLPTSVPFTVPPSGGFSLSASVPATASTGVVYLQALIQDPTAAFGITATNGVQAEVF